MSDYHIFVETLCKGPLFKGMPRSSIIDIIYAGQVQNISIDVPLFREGDSAAGLFVLLEGQVRLMKTGLQGIESIIYILKPVVMFNETTVVDGKPNPVTAIADEDCKVWQITPNRFQMLLRRYPEIGLGLLCILAERNRVLLTRYEDLMSRSVLARTAKLLYTLNQGEDTPINRYEHPNNRIAAMAATVPEAVSRSLKILKKEGIIECSRAQIRIISREKLSCYAQIEPIFLEYSKRQEVLV